MISQTFSKIKKILTDVELVDLILSKTNCKTGTIIHKHFKITRIRKFYIRKVQYTSNEFSEKLNDIVTSFPVLENIHPFHSDLIGLLYDKDNFKIALGKINSAKSKIKVVEKTYLKMIKFGDTLYRCKCLKIAALGKMASIVHKLKNELLYLENVRQHLLRLPSINPYARNIIVAGFPNVGKSSFVSSVSNCKTEVQHYPFTTQALYVGHFRYGDLSYQIIDTPGILDQPLEDKSKIEMLSITALAHLKSTLLYFLDISETCGYSMIDQIGLYNSLSPLLPYQCIVVLSKCDCLLPQSDSSEFSETTMSECISNLISTDSLLAEFLHDKKYVSISKVGMFNYTSVCGMAAEMLLEERSLTMPLKEDVTKRINMIETDTPLEPFPEVYLGANPLVESTDFRDGYQSLHKYDNIPEIFNGKNISDFLAVASEKDLQKTLDEIQVPETKSYDILNKEEYELYTEVNNARIKSCMFASDRKRSTSRIKRVKMNPHKVMNLPFNEKSKNGSAFTKRVRSGQKGKSNLGDKKYLYRGNSLGRKRVR